MAAEVLSFKFTNVSTTEERTFEGRASTHDVDLGGDIVMPGAFAKSLAEHKANGTLPLLFWMHDPTRIPGRWLDMREDSTGLYAKGRLSDTPLGNELRTLLRDGSISGLSIGFMLGDHSFDREGHRLLKQIDLWEVSLVSMPMNPKANVRTDTVKHNQLPELLPIAAFEHIARAGFNLSRSQATHFAAKAWKLYRATKTGEPVQSSMDDLRDSFESATVLAMIQAATNKMRSIE